MDLQIIKLAILGSILIYCCYLDLRTRRIPNSVWMFVLPALAFFLGYELVMASDWLRLIYLIKLGFMCAFSTALFYLGMYGGADAKALMVIQGFFPQYPRLDGFPLQIPLHEILGLSALTNACLILLVLPIYFLVRNLIQLGRSELRSRFWNYFLGYKIPISKLSQTSHIKLIQYGIRGIYPSPELISKLRAELGESDLVWVTPLLPFLIPISLGLVIAIFYGDMLFQIIQGLLRVAPVP